jgi:hypothetical protein
LSLYSSCLPVKVTIRILEASMLRWVLFTIRLFNFLVNCCLFSDNSHVFMCNRMAQIFSGDMDWAPCVNSNGLMLNHRGRGKLHRRGSEPYTCTIGRPGCWCWELTARLEWPQIFSGDMDTPLLSNLVARLIYKNDVLRLDHARYRPTRPRS